MNDNGHLKVSTLTNRLALNAILLAICIASQYFKSVSVYITGPFVNLCIILSVMMTGLWWGIAISVITPVTAFFIAASPVMQAVPWIVPLIMCGNAVLAVMVYFFFAPAVNAREHYVYFRSVLWAVLSSVAKAAFMGLTISLWLLPAFIPQASPLYQKMGVFQMTFSLTQLITALIGFVYFFLIWKSVKKAVR